MKPGPALLTVTTRGGVIKREITLLVGGFIDLAIDSTEALKLADAPGIPGPCRFQIENRGEDGLVFAAQKGERTDGQS
ncbi:MAG: hypothetical protein GWO44_18265 [Thermoplasmata archaeon]|nr:hypothetical protein [Thermoplasmata archaeon]NIY05144.1 hypothetical protein [Thermoplasmata archaeon]